MSSVPSIPAASASRTIRTRFRENPLTAQVGLAATQILDHQVNRIQCTVVNLSGTAGYVGFTDAVSTTRGILVPASGGAVSFLIREDGELTGSAMWAIQTVAAGTWYIIDVIADDLITWLRLAFLGGS